MPNQGGYRLLEKMEDTMTNGGHAVVQSPSPTQQSNQADYASQQQNEPMPFKPDNHLALAIITTICCCLPFGIVGIVKASKVNSLYLSKQYAAAQQAADEAKKWSIIGIVIGLIWEVIVFAMYGAAFIAGLSGSSY